MNRLDGTRAHHGRRHWQRHRTRFREEGASVFINDLQFVAAKAVASELGGRGYAADVSDSDAGQ